MAAEPDIGIGEGESLQVRVPVIVGAALALLGMATIVAFGFLLLFPNRIGVRFVPHRAFPAPSVVSYERSQRLVLEAQQRRALAGAGGRMPIDEAMGKIAARGARAFDPVSP